MLPMSFQGLLGCASDLVHGETTTTYGCNAITNGIYPAVWLMNISLTNLANQPLPERFDLHKLWEWILIFGQNFGARKASQQAVTSGDRS